MTTKDRVELLLKQDMKYRNSDKKLLLRYWEGQGLVLSDRQRQVFIEKCTPAESITRQRRILRVEYPGSKEVEDKRFNDYERYRHNAGYVDGFSTLKMFNN